MLARHLLRSGAGGAGAGCVPRRCYSSEQWSRLESKASGIVQGLEQQGQTVGVAELASGGLISAGNCRHSNLSPPASSPGPYPNNAYPNNPYIILWTLTSSVDVAFRAPVLQGRRCAAGVWHQPRRRPAGPRPRAQLRRGEDELWSRRHVKKQACLAGQRSQRGRLAEAGRGSGRPEA